MVARSFAGISLALSDSWELSDSLYDGTDRGGGGGGVAAGDRCAALSAQFTMALATNPRSVRMLLVGLVCRLFHILDRLSLNFG